jgi:hypothetical protein
MKEAEEALALSGFQPGAGQAVATVPSAPFHLQIHRLTTWFPEAG